MPWCRVCHLPASLRCQGLLRHSVSQLSSQLTEFKSFVLFFLLHFPWNPYCKPGTSTIPPRISTCWVNEWRFSFHMHALSLGLMVRKPCFLFLFLILRNVWRKWTLIALSRLAQHLELTFFEPMWFTPCKGTILLSLGLGISEKRQPSYLVGLLKLKCTFPDSALKGFKIRTF